VCERADPPKLAGGSALYILLRKYIKTQIGTRFEQSVVLREKDLFAWHCIGFQVWALFLK
jgi:hypothetical protein